MTRENGSAHTTQDKAGAVGARRETQSSAAARTGHFRPEVPKEEDAALTSSLKTYTGAALTLQGDSPQFRGLLCANGSTPISSGKFHCY